MKVSLNLIRKYVDLPEGLTDEQIAYDMTLRTVEVEEVENTAKKFHDIVVGEILEIKEHPNADKLRICMVDIGEEEPVQIVCGGSNLYVGEHVEAGKKSVAINLTFQDDKKTLKEQEINEAMEKILKAVEKDFGAVLRG